MQNFIDHFHFLYPWWLLLLLPLALLLWQLRRERGAPGGEWNRVVDQRLQPYVIMRGETVQQPQAWWLIALAGIIAITALAGPAWKQLPRPVHILQSPLVVLLDLSTSMYAQDVKPNRLMRARFELSDLLEARSEGQTALIVYAGDAFAVTPLTQDTDTILAQVKALSPKIMPMRGSRTDLALIAAGKLFEQAGFSSGDILLLTDDIPKAARASVTARELSSKGFDLSIIGIGTQNGAPIPQPDGGFLKDRQGNMIIAKLRMEQLRQVADAGNGVAIEATLDDSDLQQMLSRFTRHQSVSDSDSENPLQAQLWRNEGVWLLLLLLPLAALTFRRGWALALAFVIMQPAPSHAVEWSQLWQDMWLRSDQQGQRALNSGNPQQAAEKFSDPASMGVANYLAKNYQQSVDDLQQLNSVSANYNRGNALARLNKYQDAIKAYDQALQEDKTHENAIFNRDLVKKELEKQQQQQKQQEQQDPDSREDDQDQQQSQQQDNKESQEKEDQESDSQQQSEQNKEGQEQSNENKDDEEQESDSQQPEEEKEDQEQQSDSQQQSEDEKEDQEQQSDSQQQSEDEKEDQEQQAEQEQSQKDQAQQQDQQDEAGKNEQQQQAEEQQSEEMEEQENERRQGSREPKDEQEQASEQWLRQIPDDPAGLWRRKFEYQYRKRRSHPQEQSW
ncbi:MAG: VWA domain-containing protein [Pseudomonadota bacterium]|nr:VWA domain-containing protein [Pseudomonadota bacterium]